MAHCTNENYRPRKYGFGGGLAVGSLVGGYLGYKIGRAVGTRKGGMFDTEKKIGKGIKKTFSKKKKMRYGGKTSGYYNNDPRVIQAKFNTSCAETGKPIKKGQECVYYPSSKQCFSLDSKQAQEFREYMSDLNMGYNYAEGGEIKEMIEQIKSKYQLAAWDDYGVKTYSKSTAEQIASEYGGSVQEDGSKWYVSLPMDDWYSKGGSTYARGGEISRYSDFQNKVIVKGTYRKKDNSYEVVVLDYPSGQTKVEYPRTNNRVKFAKYYIEAIGKYTDGHLAEGNFTEWIKSNALDYSSLVDYADKNNVKMPSGSTYEVGGDVSGYKLYDAILQGYEGEEFALDYARQLDWGSEEYQMVNDLPTYNQYIDTINGIDVYYDYGADYYFFVETEDEYARGGGIFPNDKIGQIDQILRESDNSKIRPRLTKIRGKLLHKIRLSDSDVKFLEDKGINTYSFEKGGSTYARGGGVDDFGIGDKVMYDSYKYGTREGKILREIDDKHFEIGSGFGVSMVNKDKIIGYAPKRMFGLFEQGGNIDDIVAG